MFLGLAVLPFLLPFGTAFISTQASRTLELEIHSEDGTSKSCQFLSLRHTQHHRRLAATPARIIRESGHIRHEKDPSGSPLAYTRFYSNDESLLWSTAESHCGRVSDWSFPTSLKLDHLTAKRVISPGETQEFLQWVKPQASPPLQITSLSSSGPSENRVDLVFFSDGYTEEEHAKFIEDSKRLAADISKNQTFATVKPLLNFWAAFSASKESGIGIGGQPKDTPFGLYRDGTELRGVYYSKPEAAHAACLSMGDRCDFPILLGNDPFYGGLGGRFTVTTSSEVNGALVLRHELGHSIIDVGEEYDGGYSYFGVNTADDLSEPLPWSHWLTVNGTPQSERSVMPMQDYPWTMLNTSAPWSVSFASSGVYSRFVVRFSLSGIPEKVHLTVTLDGVDLDWAPREDIGLDRWHYDIHQDVKLSAGEHTVSFKLGFGALVGKAQLCSVEVIEFGASDEFHKDDGFIGAFPTFSESNDTTYRPTNEGCLMRTVTKPSFCSVCIEGLWIALLQRVQLIDDVQTRCHLAKMGSVERVIDVTLVPLAQFRQNPDESTEKNEAYIVTWSQNGEVLEQFQDQTSVVVENVPASYTVEVQFVTNEVRVDTYGYLISEVDIDVTSKCIAART